MQKTERVALYVDPQRRGGVEALAAEAARADVTLRAIEPTPELADRVRELDACALVVRADDPTAEDVCLRIRTDPRLSAVPVIGMTPRSDDLAFVEFFSWGGDDLVELAATGALERRMRLLPRGLTRRAVAPRGVVLIADDDQRRRIILARVLRNAGFDARFAVDSDELAREGRAEGAILVFCAVDLPPSGAITALKSVRSGGNTVPWIISASPQRFGRAVARAVGMDPVTVYDSYAPTENALFCANEALRQTFAEQRASPRLLFGTTVAFRQAGRDRDELGYAYNISAEGLYVRTLAPPDTGTELWIELQPPRTQRRVRLEASVVWRRLLSAPEGATVPPGFGLRITGGSDSDRERFRSGYNKFRTDFLAARVTVPPSMK